MPYETVKIVRKLDTTFPSYGFVLEDDETWKRFCSLVYKGDPNIVAIDTTVANLLDKDGRINTVVNKDYTFPLFIRRFGYDQEVRTLVLTDYFLTSYPVKEGTPIHLFLNTIIKEENKIEISIFAENVRGIMDVEPRNKFGELLVSTDVLITEKLTDDYYANLVSEINWAFNYKIPNATIVLLRKLFENLIVDLLKAMYGYANTEPYYSISMGRHLSLNDLIPNLRKSMKKPKVVDERFCQEENKLFPFFDAIKQQGGASAHVLSLEKDMAKTFRLRSSINEYLVLITGLTAKLEPIQPKWVWEN